MCEKMRLQKSSCWTINFILEEKEDENEEEGEYRMMIMPNDETELLTAHRYRGLGSSPS